MSATSGATRQAQCVRRPGAKRSHAWLGCLLAPIVLSVGVASPAAAQYPRPCRDSAVVVNVRSVDVRVAMPQCQGTRTVRPTTGWLGWRVEFLDSARTTVAIRPTALPVTRDPARSARGSRIWRCPPRAPLDGPPSLLACASPVSGRVTARDLLVQAGITDTAIIGALQRARPTRAWVTRIEPGGRFSLEQVEVLYRADR